MLFRDVPTNQKSLSEELVACWTFIDVPEVELPGKSLNELLG